MLDETREQLNKCLAMYDGLVSENSHRYIQPYSTLGTLLEAEGDYEAAEVQFHYVIKLLLANDYFEESPYVIQYTDRVKELMGKIESEN